MASIFLLLLLPLLGLSHTTVMGDEALRRMSILNRLMRRRDDFWLEQPRLWANTDCGKAEFFDQKADHFNQSDTATFKQVICRWSLLNNLAISQTFPALPKQLQIPLEHN